ncbi:hypothetical protein HG531_006446 [Fusarium graminearum]|nr:hypothetical protein HG531_006446 [Fusarium graminearum]
MARLRIEYMKFCRNSRIDLYGFRRVVGIRPSQDLRLNLLFGDDFWNNLWGTLCGRVSGILGQHVVDRLDRSSKCRAMKWARRRDRILLLKLKLLQIGLCSSGVGLAEGLFVFLGCKSVDFSVFAFFLGKEFRFALFKDTLYDKLVLKFLVGATDSDGRISEDEFGVALGR